MAEERTVFTAKKMGKEFDAICLRHTACLATMRKSLVGSFTENVFESVEANVSPSTEKMVKRQKSF